MSSSSKTASPPSAPATPRPAERRVRLFHVGLAAAMALTVLAGFGPTYYLRFFSGGPEATISNGPFTALIHTHGALFTSWVLLFLVQTTLVARWRIAAHRRLGIAGAFLAAAMIVSGTLAAIATARRGAAPGGGDPLAFLIIPLFDMILFAGFLATALALRGDPERHKRLMVMAYVSIMVAAVGRLPGLLALGPPAFFGLTLIFVAAAAIHDLRSRGRVHPVYVWGGAILIASVPLRLALSTTMAWRSVAEMLTR